MLDEALEESEVFETLDERDRRFVYHLLMSYWRHKGVLEHVVAQCLEKKLPAKSQEIATILSLGACEILHLDTPDYAVVNSYVTLAKQGGDAKKSGLVNAVLKRIAREGVDRLREEIDTLQLSVPAWLWRSWKAAYGEDKTRRMVAQQQKPAPLDLSVKDDPDIWAKRLGGEVIAGQTVRLPAQPVTALDGYAEGEWWVQDVAAAFPVELLGEVKGKRVLDLCAAPGGKTAQLASRGAEVTALDRSLVRLERLKGNLARLKLTVELIEADIFEWQAPGLYDAILLDAPCSATGTTRRNPDVVWARRPAMVRELATLQHRMLKQAVQWLKPGGRLIYCVCSLQPEEGEKQILRFLNECKDMQLVDIASLATTIPDPCITKRGMLRCLPCHLAEQGGMDGFFAAVLTKK